jgi:hypothetical protein
MLYWDASGCNLFVSRRGSGTLLFVPLVLARIVSLHSSIPVASATLICIRAGEGPVDGDHVERRLCGDKFRIPRTEPDSALVDLQD